MPFYVIVWQIIISDLMEQLPQIFIAVPLTFGLKLYSDQNSFIFQAIAIFETIAFCGSLYFNLILSINRFIIFIFPRFNHVLFEFPNIKL